MIWRVRNKILYICLICGICVFTACESEKTFSAELNETVASINKKCPQMLDSETRIDGVEIKGSNVLVYKYTLVNVLKQNVDTHQFYLALWPGLLSTIKVSPEMKSLRENGTIVQYTYNDKQNNPFYSFTIKPQDYNTP